jgi:hypothetical protein
MQRFEERDDRLGRKQQQQGISDQQRPSDHSHDDGSGPPDQILCPRTIAIPPRRPIIATRAALCDPLPAHTARVRSPLVGQAWLVRRRVRGQRVERAILCVNSSCQLNRPAPGWFMAERTGCSASVTRSGGMGYQRDPGRSYRSRTGLRRQRADHGGGARLLWLPGGR